MQTLNFMRTKCLVMLFENYLNIQALLGYCSARVFGYNVGNIIYLLFLDTNHHVYFNPKYGKDALFYEDCPVYKENKCAYMPTDCFAVEYLDENKLSETYGYIK